MPSRPRQPTAPKRVTRSSGCASDERRRASKPGGSPVVAGLCGAAMGVVAIASILAGSESHAAVHLISFHVISFRFSPATERLQELHRPLGDLLVRVVPLGGFEGLLPTRFVVEAE